MVLPMLATAGALPGDDAGRYGYEVKWDGVRAVGYVGPGFRLTGRRGTDITATYPEAAELTKLLAGHSAIVDGELVILDADGVPRFAELQHRMHVAGPSDERMRRYPVEFLLFDLLWFDGRPLLDLGYALRRELLDELALDGAAVQTPPALTASTPAQAAATLEATRQRGLEGLVLKTHESRYLPGRRSPDWIKVKNVAHQEVVVGGWRPGRGRRAGGIGSLLVGVPTGDRLRYAGRVGTGFTDETLDTLAAALRPLARTTSPLDDVPPADARDAHWVHPRLVGEVEYTMWTDDHRLRAPSWRGLRPDKTPAEIIAP